MPPYSSTTPDFDNIPELELPTFDGDGENVTSPEPPRTQSASASEPVNVRRRKAKLVDATSHTRDDAAENTPTSAKDREERHTRGLVSRLFADGRPKLFAGIVLLIFALFLFISAISYFSAGETDQSAVMHRTVTELSTTPDSVSNVGGPVGAYFAHSLVSDSLGLAAFVVIFYLCGLGLRLLNVVRIRFWRFTSKCLLAIIAISIIAGLVAYDFEGPIYWGGVHGHYVNRMLISYSGVVGAICISIIMLSLFMLMFLPEITTGTKFVRTQIYKRTERLRRERRKKDEHPDSGAHEATPPVEKANYDSGYVTPGSEGHLHHEYEQETIHEYAERGREEDPDLLEPIGSDEFGNENERGETEDAPATQHPLQPSEDFTVNAPAEIEEARNVALKPYDPTADLPNFRFPSLDCLVERGGNNKSVDLEEQEENKERITKTLNDYGIGIQSIEATVGPTVTLYEIVPAEGVRIAKIKRLEDDIALSLAALGIRIIAPIPGRGTIGIEVPNKDPQIVSMRSIITSEPYQKTKMELPMAMGATIAGDVFMADLTKMPHLMVAGATGMGKSVGLNAIITSLLYKKHPAELKFVLIDPKMVEFSIYSRLENHYLAKLPDEEDAIITDPSKVVTTLKSLCVEMDQRYALLKEANLRNIKEYNSRFIERRLNPEKGHHYMPYIVVIVDEFADLIMTAGKEVETPIARIAQKARAVGMHLILATQRPSTNVITGIIKANFPGRVAFRVTQMVDSRTILDRPGANQLIGRGDMLFSRDGDITRVQCAFIDTPEVDAICDEIDRQIGYEHAFFLPEPLAEESEGISLQGFGERDPLFDEAARAIVQSGVASTSSLQRRYSIGYNRAGKIMDQLEAAGIVGPSQGGKPRSILIDPGSLESILSA